MITIVLADDHSIVRQGLKAVLNAENGLTVIGDAADGAAALKLVSELRPQVLLLDLMMPGIGGLEALRQLRSSYPQTRAVVLSMHANEAYVVEALRCGALGYVLKGSDSPILVAAVRTVAAGRRFLGPPLSEAAIDAYHERTGGSAPLDPLTTLTAREREILTLVAAGSSSAEVAERLALSSRTVEVHRANIMRKLGLQNQTEVVRYAIRRGIISLEGE